jgi:hypothetical protein
VAYRFAALLCRSVRVTTDGGSWLVTSWPAGVDVEVRLEGDYEAITELRGLLGAITA